MNKPKTFVSVLLFVTILAASTICSFAYNIEEFGLKNIVLPDGYIACTRTECDEKLQSIIEGSGFSGLDAWNSQVMIPGNYHIYACMENNLSKCIYLVCEELKNPKTRDGLVTHKLAQDYNMAKTPAEKAQVLDDLKRAATTNEANWVSTGAPTEYIEYFYNVGDDFLHVYQTIYNGNKITLQFSSKKSFTDAEKEEHLKVLSSVEYTEYVDYIYLKEEIRKATQKKLEEDTNSGENTRILRYIIGASVAFVIVFAVYISIRSQNKKRRKTIVLREPEVINDDDGSTDNNNNSEGDK